MKTYILTGILSLFTTVTLFAQIDLKKGLVAEYTFNNNVKNQAGNHSHGMLSGGKYVGGKNLSDFNCLSFDGINDNVILAIDSFTHEEYSYSLWTRPSKIPRKGKSEIIFDIGGFGGDQLIQLSNDVNSSEAPYKLNGFYAGGYIAGTKVSRVVTNTLPDTSSWYHLVLVRFDKGKKFYVNCKLVDSLIDNSKPNYGSQEAVSIGSRFNGTNYYNGKVDNIRLYNRPLNLAEVKILGGCRELDIEETENKLTIGFQIFPNPAENSFTLKMENNWSVSKVNVYDAMGKLIKMLKLNSIMTTINSQDWSSGMYTIVVTSQGKVYSQKVQKF